MWPGWNSLRVKAVNYTLPVEIPLHPGRLVVPNVQVAKVYVAIARFLDLCFQVARGFAGDQHVQRRQALTVEEDLPFLTFWKFLNHSKARADFVFHSKASCRLEEPRDRETISCLALFQTPDIFPHGLPEAKSCL